MPKNWKLPELELMILRQLWSLRNRASVQEVLSAWEDKKVPLYTTILKKLQVMEAKGLVKHEKEGKAYKYIPLVSREEVSRGSLRSLIRNFFSRNKLELFHAFLDETELDSREIKLIRQMLVDKEKEVQE